MATLVHCMTVSESSWAAFKQTFSKKYNSPEEEANRQRIWQANSAYIQRHNDEADLGLHTFRLGMNQYGDLELQEFQRLFNNYSRLARMSHEKSPLAKNGFANSSIPDEVDWRNSSYVTAVKDQGSCKSGWAFAALASLEGQQFNKTGELISLSAQQLVDCSTDFGNEGCAGGDPLNAFEYIMLSQGVDTDESYPYEAHDAPCRFTNGSSVGATIAGFIYLDSGDEQALAESVATVGPISVAIDANHASFQL